MGGFFKKAIVHVLALSILSLGSPVVAQAEIIGTLAGLESHQRARSMERVQQALAREEVRAQMLALGVDESMLEARLARLTDSELSALAADLDNLPAGAGVLEVVGIVFVVLLILEAVGVIDVFKKFP
ncbi:MAG TPA: PA2779 family protein [Steroidobacteraceae bacterium]